MLGALAAGVIQGAGSLFSGFGAASKQRARDKANVRAMDVANQINAGRTEDMNRQIRARADAAALVPVVTTTNTDYGRHEETLTAGDINVDAFIKQSNAMGINPISMLRSGAMGYYARTSSQTRTGGRDSVTTTTTGERAMDAALAGSEIPYYQANQLLGAAPQSTGEILGGSLSDAYGAYSQVAANDMQNAYQMAALQQQARSYAASSRAPVRVSSFGAPSVTTAGPRRSTAGSGSLGATPGPAPDGYFLGGGLDAFSPNSDKRTPLDAFRKDYGDEVPDYVGGARFLYDWALNPDLRDAIDARVHFAPAYHERSWPVRPGNYGKPYDPSKSVFQ